MDAERQELQQASRRFIRSMFRTGVSLALAPVSRLPRKSQQHFQAAGREFTRGLATLVHGFAENLEEIAQDASRATDFEEGLHTSEEPE
jgi:histone H3/H4